MPRAPFLLLLFVASGPAWGGPASPPPVMVNVISPEARESFPDGTETVLLDAALTPLQGYKFKDFVCRWSVDGVVWMEGAPDAYGHCGVDWPAIDSAPGTHQAALGVFWARPPAGSLSSLIVTHRRPFSLAFGPELANLTASLSGDFSDATVRLSFDLTDKLLYAVPSADWVDVDILYEVAVEDAARTPFGGADGVVNTYADSSFDGHGNRTGWVRVDAEIPVGDVTGADGCELWIGVGACEDILGDYSGADASVTIPVGAPVAASWVDGSTRDGAPLGWSASDPESSYEWYGINGSFTLPSEVAWVELELVNPDTSTTTEASCTMLGTSSVTCSVHAGEMTAGTWLARPLLYGSDNTLLCYAPTSFELDLEPYDVVDNDGDLQAESDGDCDDVNSAVYLSSDIADDNCDMVNDNCDSDTILTWGGMVTGVINDGNMDDEAVYPDNDTTITRVDATDFESLPFHGGSTDVTGNLHQPGDQDWFLFEFGASGRGEAVALSLTVPDDGSGVPGDVWKVGVMTDDTYSGGFSDGEDYWGLGGMPPATTDCTGTTCTMEWTFLSGTDFRGAASYWAVGVGHADGTWVPEMCDDGSSATPSTYSLSVTRL